MTSNRIAFEKENYIIKELGSGSYGTVYASIPKYLADQILSDFSQRKASTDALLLSSSSAQKATALTLAKTSLRSALQAAKISKAGKSFHHERKLDLALEIQTLQLLLKRGNFPNIVRLRSSDDSIEKGWLTLELLSGRNLTQFTEVVHLNNRWRSPLGLLPVGFVWHCLFQLAEGLLALQFGGGEQSGAFSTDQKFAHTDLAGRNLMFRPQGHFRGYPDLVIVDLGSVEKVPRRATEAAMRMPVNYRGVDHQALDLKMGINVLQGIFGRVVEEGDAELRGFVERLQKWKVEGEDEKADQSLYDCLMGMSGEAMKGREERYEALPGWVGGYFEEYAEVVSDEDLERFFPQLAS